MKPGKQSISDELLFIRYSEGDGEAFRVLLDRYAVRLLQYCRGFVKSEDEAEDLVQETFLRAIRSASTYRATTRFSTWIHTIARNLCLDKLKAKQLRRNLWISREEGIAEATMGSQPPPPDESAEGIILQTLESAISHLTSLEAETIRLTFMAGCSTGQIAELQGCSRATVRARRFQALQKLRATLNRKGTLKSELREEQTGNG